jgi:hypothetical protein
MNWMEYMGLSRDAECEQNFVTIIMSRYSFIETQEYLEYIVWMLEAIVLVNFCIFMISVAGKKCIQQCLYY